MKNAGNATMKPETSSNLFNSKQAVLFAVVLIAAGTFALAQGDAVPAAPTVAEAQAQPIAPGDAPHPGEGPYTGDTLPPGHPPIGGEGVEAPATGALPFGHPPIDDTTPAVHATAGNAVVRPIEGGVTVEKVYADAAALAGKQVKLAVRVVKSTPNILGRTWLHVQDGSGDGQRGNDDLVVTTQKTPSVGQLIVIEGVVVRDRDLGSGYRYDVLIEDATVREAD